MLSDKNFRIGGLVKVDSVNYPGFVACTVFTRGCNFRCPYCHNPSLVEPSSFEKVDSFTVQEVFDYINQRKGLLDAVVVSGGEPCLQPGLANFLKQVKDLGLKTKLDTNGSFPQVLENLLKNGLLDYVAMDIKTFALGYERVGFSNVADIESSVCIIKNSAPDYEFRITCEKSVVSPKDFKALGIWLKGAKRLYLQRFNPKVVLDERLKDTEQYTSDELESFAQELGKNIDKVCIR